MVRRVNAPTNVGALQYCVGCGLEAHDGAHGDPDAMGGLNYPITDWEEVAIHDDLSLLTPHFMSRTGREEGEGVQNAHDCNGVQSMYQSRRYPPLRFGDRAIHCPKQIEHLRRLVGDDVESDRRDHGAEHPLPPLHEIERVRVSASSTNEGDCEQRKRRHDGVRPPRPTTTVFEGGDDRKGVAVRQSNCCQVVDMRLLQTVGSVDAGILQRVDCLVFEACAAELPIYAVLHFLTFFAWKSPSRGGTGSSASKHMLHKKSSFWGGGLGVKSAMSVTSMLWWNRGNISPQKRVECEARSISCIRTYFLYVVAC
jgi:hypothetical protein